MKIVLHFAFKWAIVWSLHRYSPGCKTCNQSHSGDQAGLDCSFLSRCWPKRCFLKRCYWQGFARNLAIEADWENIYGIEAFHEWHLFKIQHPSARWMRAKLLLICHNLSHAYLPRECENAQPFHFTERRKHECFFKWFNLFKRPQVMTRLNWAVALQFACYIDIPWISARWIGIPLGGFVCFVEMVKYTVYVVVHLLNQLNDPGGPNKSPLDSSQFTLKNKSTSLSAATQ